MESLTWGEALAWRMRRQFLDPVGDAPAVEVARRLAGVQAQVASAAELAVALRQTTPRDGEVDPALWDEGCSAMGAQSEAGSPSPRRRTAFPAGAACRRSRTPPVR